MLKQEVQEILDTLKDKNMNENYKSNLKVSDESKERGRIEEELFQKCIIKFKGLKCEKSTPKQDRFNHIDFFLSNGMSVDVKAHKRINATDKEVSTEYTWIELDNQNGNLGWVSGWATHIAYSFTTHYILFNREALKKYVYSKVRNLWDVKIKPYSTFPDLYQPYRRGDLKDKIVLVPIADLIKNVPHLKLERDEQLLNN